MLRNKAGGKARDIFNNKAPAISAHLVIWIAIEGAILAIDLVSSSPLSREILFCCGLSSGASLTAKGPGPYGGSICAAAAVRSDLHSCSRGPGRRRRLIFKVEPRPCSPNRPGCSPAGAPAAKPPSWAAVPHSLGLDCLALGLRAVAGAFQNPGQ